MPHTYFQLLYHLVWSTKEREPLMTQEHRSQMFRYLGGILCSLECSPIEIGGVADHVHILVDVPPKKAIAEIVREAKIGSSKWAAQTLSKNRPFAWQQGYGAFTVSHSSSPAVISYIQDQERHHQQRDFKTEFLELLQKHKIAYEERYLWK